MTSSKPPSASKSLDWRLLLGLIDPGDADWAVVRAAQLNAVNAFGLLRMMTGSVAAVILVISLRGTVAVAPLFGWLAVMLGLSAWVAAKELRLRQWPLPVASRAELHGKTATALLFGLLWAVPPVFFIASGAALEQTMAVWTVATALMAAAALALSPVPLATSLFILLVGSGVTAMMHTLGMPVLTFAAASYTALLIVCCVANGRAFILHKSSDIDLEEKNEVVSLLLREYEDSNADWLWQIDTAKCITHVSPRFAAALGRNPAELEGKPLLQTLAGDTWEHGNFPAGLRELAEKVKHRESFSNVLLPVTLNATTRWWEVSASPRIDERGFFLGFRGVGSDVTEARASADKINRMARYDTLTGMPNRLLVTESVKTAMDEAERWRSRCAFMMIDLDRFKAVNDTLGHPVGDRLLGRVAERLRAMMTDNEICGRLGGDEFGVVVRDATDSARVERLAKKIIAELSRPYEVDQHTLYIGCSIGTAIGPRDGKTVEMLIRSADLALYRSKDQGGGLVHAYEPQLHAHAEERRVLEIALRQALEKGQLSLHYQPVVAADDGTIEGFEALLRWTHPELGSISPAKFIPVAEEARLITPIGEWVLRTACNEAVSWPGHIRIAVNVSPEQLTDQSFVAMLVSALAQSGLPASRLELEVTESVFMREGTGAVAVLDQILALGVRLALDDFGTGYSSLGYLRKTRFNAIKIDRSFVQGAARNVPESLAIVRAVVAMADSLGMSTTAEGAETEEEYAMIRRLGCRKVQGYLFGRPMPAEQARALLAPYRDRSVA